MIESYVKRHILCVPWCDDVWGESGLIGMSHGTSAVETPSWVMSRMKWVMSHVKRVMSRWNESWHGRMNESWYICSRDSFMSHVTHEMSHVMLERVMAQTHDWVMSHMKIRHVTLERVMAHDDSGLVRDIAHMKWVTSHWNESWHICSRDSCMNHVTRKTSHVTLEWVMARKNEWVTSRVKWVMPRWNESWHINESCHICNVTCEMSHVTLERLIAQTHKWVMSHVKWVMAQTHSWVMPHMKWVTSRWNESWLMKSHVISEMSHVTLECVMAQTHYWVLSHVKWVMAQTH